MTPKASSACLDGTAEDAEGRRFLRVRVTEAPEKGKANAAVVKLLAKALRLPKSAIEVVSGESDRNKTVAIRGEPEALMARLEALLTGGDRG